MARTAVYGEDVRTEVVGTEGSVLIGHLPFSHGAWAGRAGIAADPFDPSVLRFTSAYAAQVEAFVAAIAADVSVSPDGGDALLALRIALAARRSAEQGVPVRVDGSA